MGNPTPVGPATKLARGGGSITVNSDGSMSVAPATGKTISIAKLATPSLADDAATKAYADSVGGGGGTSPATKQVLAATLF